ncbi:hypothetical protein [uncultured Tenacibaculum sp.]|uniref:hypothetical protein n=1 Tax=uncultured Tenacibaculum sp. TaxID=174713 RepID=UPI00261FBCCE|nr:hypothetical protein [uncultured Tenacibaculum sp.]
MKLLQLVNRTILALVILVCFSFTTKNDDKYISSKKSLDPVYILLTYNPTHNKFENSSEYTIGIPDITREDCLGGKFVFVRKITNYNITLSDNQEIWKVIPKNNDLTRTVGLGGNQTDVDPNKPNPLACQGLTFQFISNPEPRINILPDSQDAFFKN